MGSWNMAVDWQRLALVKFFLINICLILVILLSYPAAVYSVIICYLVQNIGRLLMLIITSLWRFLTSL